MSTTQGAIAATRFGLGARPGEIAAATSDPRGWLLDQLKRTAAVSLAQQPLPTGQEGAAKVVEYTQLVRQQRQSGDPDAQMELQRALRSARRDGFGRELIARAALAERTDASFNERWVRFWSNHFTVAITQPLILPLVGPYEREAIRQNAFGSFRDLLQATSFHQTMLVYLDNIRSFGPSTRIAQRRGVGLNENLAREILELHTLGVDGGYTQQDVTEFAKALTGWTIKSPPLANSDIGAVTFEPRLHEPGARTVLGQRVSEGADQASAVLDMAAAHPSTATHIATKLARHFVADMPPQSAITTLSRAFRDTGGDLTELAKAVINLDAAWGEEQVKFKSPDELLVSTARMVGSTNVFGGGQARDVYTSFGQVPFYAPSPQGWPDTASEWAGPDAIMKRLEWANLVAQRTPSDIAAGQFLDEGLGPLVSADTRQAVARAESAIQGLTLALMSPEFQRR
ncbi:MAG: DUF1800 domain-containing protein [Pseudomonadota bacterium]